MSLTCVGINIDVLSISDPSDVVLSPLIAHST